jgi:hypothetical protein
MLKLSALLKETYLAERALDLTKKEDAAEYLIRQAWKYIPPGEDRYDPFDVIIWIDNEQPLSNLAWSLAEKFYPQEDEAWYRFKDDVENVLHRMEMKRLERRKRYTPSLKDPLYILKKTMVGKSWEQAKRTIAKNSLGAWGVQTMEKINDQDANQVFERLYKRVMGETWYDKSLTDNYGYGRLSDLKENPNDKNDVKQYSINVFIRQYGTDGGFGEMVKVWRGTNNPHAGITPGDFVTFDRGYAQTYHRGKWKSIVTDALNSKDLIVYKIEPGSSELVYWPEGHQIKKYEGPIPTLRDFWEQYRFGI